MFILNRLLRGIVCLQRAVYLYGSGYLRYTFYRVCSVFTCSVNCAGGVPVVYNVPCVYGVSVVYIPCVYGVLVYIDSVFTVYLLFI